MHSGSNHIIYEDTPELEKARSAFLSQDYARSLRLFERAVNKQPNNIMALTDAARAFGQRYEIKMAADLVERMLLLGKSNPQVRFLAAQTCRMIYRTDEALEHFQMAVKSGNTPIEAHLELAFLLERRHQLEQALEETETFLIHEPNNPEATLLKARIIRRMGNTNDAETIYNELSSRNGCALFTKAQALNEWANMLDTQGEYHEAFGKLRESKSIIAELPETQQTQKRCVQEHQWLQHLIDSITSNHLQRWMDRQDQTNHRSTLLTGCPRSGTTLIEKILDAHPEVVSADELSAFTSYILPGLLKGKRDREGFFDATTLDKLPPIRLRNEEKRYLRYLQDAINEPINQRILVDKNPSVTFMIPVHQIVWPQNRILYALRDPRDIAISCFFRWLPTNSMSVRFLSLEDTCKRTAEELQCWMKLRKMLPEESWHETRYEDTIANYQDESRKVLEWMGLAWNESISNYRNHMEKRGVNSPTYEAVTQPIYKNALGRWKNYAAYLDNSCMDQLQEVIDAFDYDS